MLTLQACADKAPQRLASEIKYIFVIKKQKTAPF